MRAIRMTDLMNCPISDTSFEKMIECLRKVDAKKITGAGDEFYVRLIYSLKGLKLSALLSIINLLFVSGDHGFRSCNSISTGS